jgi:hypothetical protein
MYEQHTISMIAGMGSELKEEHDVRFNGEGNAIVITMSKISGVVEELYGLVVGLNGPKIRQLFSPA